MSHQSDGKFGRHEVGKSGGRGDERPLVTRKMTKTKISDTMIFCTSPKFLKV